MNFAGWYRKCKSAYRWIPRSDNLLRRIPSDDLDFVITAINVQREVGGNLSEILETISFTIRERVKIKGEIRVVTSQVRASGTHPGSDTHFPDTCFVVPQP